MKLQLTSCPRNMQTPSTCQPQMISKPAIFAVLLLWTLGCTAEPEPDPPPATLLLHAESEHAAERLTTAFARPPLLAPDEALVPGLFEVESTDAERIVLSPTSAWESHWPETRTRLRLSRLRGNPPRSGPAGAVEATASHLRSRLSPRADHPDAFRLYFIEAAARHNRGHAPGSSLGIETDGQRLILSRADLRDVTVTAVPEEVENRLMVPAFSPPLGDEAAGELPAAGLEVASGRGGDSLSDRLPEIIIIMVDGKEHTRLHVGSEKEYSLPPREEREPVEHGTLESDGTRYDLLVANTDGEHLESRDVRRAVFDTALAALGVDPGAVGSDAETGEGRRADAAPDAGSSDTDPDDAPDTALPGALPDDAVIAVAAPPALAGRGEEVVSALAREGVDARVHTDSWEAYREAMFEGDYDLALLRWETESGSEGEVLRLFREYDPRNYAEWQDSQFSDAVGDGLESAGDYRRAWERLGERAVARRIEREKHQLEYELLAPDDHTIAPLELNVFALPWFRDDQALDGR